MDSVFDFHICRSSVWGKSSWSVFVQCCGVVAFEVVLYLPGGGVKKKKMVLTYENALLSKKFAQFQRQALVSIPAFLEYGRYRGFHWLVLEWISECKNVGLCHMHELEKSEIDISRVGHYVLGSTRFSVGRREYWMKGPIEGRKKNRMSMQIKNSRK